MAKPNITLRSVKGDPLTFTEMDTNFTNLQDATYTFAGNLGTPTVVDLNGSVTISGGTGLTSTASAGTVTLDLDNTAVAAASYNKANVTVDAQGRITSASDGTITSGEVTTALGYTPENTANKNTANGYAGLDGTGKVASAQLPSYVDDVLEYASQANFPATGETAKIYVATDTGKIYRWSGSVYAEISPSPGTTDDVPEGTVNLYYSDGLARSSISATQNLTYNNSTGVITGPDLTVLNANVNAQDNTISNVNLSNYKETVFSLGTTDAPAINVANGNVQTVTITTALSLPAFTSPEAGQSVTLIVTGSGTASGTADYQFAGGATTLTTKSLVSIFYDGTNYLTSISTDYQ